MVTSNIPDRLRGRALFPNALLRMSSSAWLAYCSAAASMAALSRGSWSAMNSSVAARVPQYGQ
jgi:hypothetical protein